MLYMGLWLLRAARGVPNRKALQRKDLELFWIFLELLIDEA